MLFLVIGIPAKRFRGLIQFNTEANYALIVSYKVLKQTGKSKQANRKDICCRRIVYAAQHCWQIY